MKLALLSAVGVLSCNILATRPQQAEVQRTFAELSDAEKYAYLRAVLGAQREVIRGIRIARVKSLDEKITHNTTLTAKVETDGYARHKKIRVQWSTLQADSIELLRCKLQNIDTGAKVKSDNNVVGAGQVDFVKLQSSPNDYGYLACDRVYGNIHHNTSVLDSSAENNFKYVYFLRPCFKNYAVVLPADENTPAQQCNKAALNTAENDQAALSRTAKHTIVFRYCQTEARQVCSDKVSQSNRLIFNQGQIELPLHLYDERRRLIAEIAKHEDSLYSEGYAALTSMVDGVEHDIGMTRDKWKKADYATKQLTQLAYMDDLQTEHEDANKLRAEKAASVMSWTGIIAHPELAQYFGDDMSFGSENCYDVAQVAGDTIDEMEAEGNQQLREQLGEDFAEENALELSDGDCMWGMGLKRCMQAAAVSGCLIENIARAGKLVDVDLKKLDFSVSKKISDTQEKLSKSKEGAQFGKTEYALAAANFAIGMIPLENSALNRGGSIAAFSDALTGIFMSEDNYLRQHCQPCLQHMAQVRYHTRKIYYLQQQLGVTQRRINDELTERGAVDPDAP